jgi:hypothetical protein
MVAMRARTVFFAFGLALLAIAGCEKNEGVFPENQMPHTYLSIINASGPTDTTDYRKILHWWGSDRDGKVTGYLIRWTGDWEPAAGTRYDYRGLAYTLTTATDDTFDVPVSGDFATRSFTVRAVDDRGLVDSLGVTQSYQVTNHIPDIQWNPDFVLPDTSLAAVSFSWRASDLDGRATIHTFKLWLDDDVQHTRTVSDTIASVRPEDFLDRVDGVHTLHIRGYDNAQTPTPETLEHTWYVRWPQDQPYLLIRQYTASGALDKWDRRVYEAILKEMAGGLEHVYVIDMNKGHDFATAEEIDPLFSLFDGVAWLTGPYDQVNDAKMVRNLSKAVPGMLAYANRGGRMLIIGQSVLGTNAALSSRFARDELGIPRFFRRIAVEPGEVTSTSLPLAKGQFVYFGAGSPSESLQVLSTSNQVDFFLAPTSPGTGRYWVAPGTLRRMLGRNTDPSQDSTAAYLGIISSVGQGRITIVTNGYARLFPNPPSSGEYPLPDDLLDLQEGLAFFREALLP